MITLLAPAAFLTGFALPGDAATDWPDWRGPDRNGIALLKKIKASYPEVTVIMLTNFDNPQYRRACQRLGADYFLNKTLEFEKIVDTITRVPSA